MQLFQVVTLEEAKKQIKASLSKNFPSQELKPISQADGMVLADDVYSELDIPGFDRSTVDGYALSARETQGAGDSIPAFFRCVGDVKIGQPAEICLESGQCSYVPTGGMLPQGADAVVMTEYCERFQQADIAVYRPVGAGENTVLRGEDVRKGQMLLTRGTRLGPAALGVLAAAGVERVPVFRPYRVAVLSTGDELSAPGEPLRPGRIYDINTPALEACARAEGMSVILTQVIRDDPVLLRNAVKEAMGTADAVIVSGGSSQGKHDLTLEAFSALAHPGLLFHGLAVKPGKPTLAAWDEQSGSLLLGLPGHPVAALLVFRFLLADALHEAMGMPPPLTVPACMEHGVPCDAGKENFIPARLSWREGTLWASPIRGKSGLITTLSSAQGIILAERNQEGLQPGESVRVRLL